jgi:tetratricopeptide (TPR) repeat protein
LTELCAHPYINTANYLKLRGDLSQWDVLYDRALSLIQDAQWSAQTWSNRAEGDLLRGDKEKAIGSYLNAASIYISVRDTKNGRANAQKAATLDPSNPDLKRLSASFN